MEMITAYSNILVLHLKYETGNESHAHIQSYIQTIHSIWMRLKRVPIGTDL